MDRIKTAIVVPVYQESISKDERISLDLLNRNLGSHDLIVITHKGLMNSISCDKKILFSKEFFLSQKSYSKLLLSPKFYAAFSDYTYVLVYQLDCLVFSGDFLEKIDVGIDYFGAPIFVDSTDTRPRILGVGNGGLSLRRVAASLGVLRSQRRPPYSYSLTGRRWMCDLRTVPARRRMAKALRVIREARRGVEWYTSHYTLNEDMFWSFRAPLFDPSFRVAPVEKALEFSFERFPRYCYELNDHRLPFGCHAWAKHDRAFWEQFIDVDNGN